MMVLDTGSSGWVGAVAFYPDGRHFLGGGGEAGVQRWRVSDGQEVRKQTGMDVYAISVSKDQKWIACGTKEGASVWDGEMHGKVIAVEGTNTVYAVDVSPDSTRFATGTGNNASIWSIPSGERLVGPLEHDTNLFATGIRFSANGEHIAIACMEDSIRIFDSQTGDKLVIINTDILNAIPVIPLVWSSDEAHWQQIFAVSNNKIRAFDTSTGTLLAESQTLHDGGNDTIHSIALAANNKFIATSGDNLISFLDTSTLTRIGPDIENNKQLASVTISADSSHLATARDDGKIIIRDLSKILPDSYGPFHISTCTFIMSTCQVIFIPSPMVIKLHRHLLTMEYDKRSSL